MVNLVPFSYPAVQAALAEGNVARLNILLGYEYSIRGMVIQGNNLGRTIGFPTANLSLLQENPPLISNGVYAVKILVNDIRFTGMANIGFRPTLKGTDLTFEVHIFDFSEDIYDQVITVSFVDRIRSERKFADLEELQHQLRTDRETALKLFGRRADIDPDP